MKVQPLPLAVPHVCTVASTKDSRSKDMPLIIRVLARAESPFHAQGIFPFTLSLGDTMSSATGPSYRLSAWRYLLAHRWTHSQTQRTSYHMSCHNRQARHATSGNQSSL